MADMLAKLDFPAAGDVAELRGLFRIPLDRIVPGPNARGDVGDVGELALSIKTIGLQKPLLVTPLDSDLFRIVDGHRRYSALRRLGHRHADAIVRRTPTEQARLQQQLAMHAQAKGFDPIAEARALHTLMFEHNLTREQIAAAVGHSPIWVRDRIGLLNLTEAEQDAVRRGRMSMNEAAGLLRARRDQRDGRPARPPAAPKTTRAHGATCTCTTRKAAR